ncbi:hypothetical protein I4J37_10780 [Corynebacterium belfantii]|uniref:hypothetical protein n=1 Tax=Corynebacterium belfantii TaxID=2014537 RepID=UPI0018D2BF9B|nr:hypothetical protein [Corynebacterium belfantii]MBG9320189.1 hypothetical protein [Corynebacterium belfantii]MBG9331792.1 hypothetical protein [Corynebacterium belfantii]
MPRYITISIGFTATGTLFRLAELVANELADDHDLNIEPNIVALALEEWSEQALLHIDDTPAPWIANALAIQTHAYNAVDTAAENWLELAVTDAIERIYLTTSGGYSSIT